MVGQFSTPIDTPIYYDAFVAVNGVRARDSLKGLLPGEDRRFTVPSGGTSPELTVECDRIVPGQHIEFEAELETTPEAS